MKIFFWFIFELLFIGQTVWASNLGQLIKRSRQMTGDSSYYQSLPRLSDQRIIDYLNEAQDFVSSRWVLVQRSTFNLTAGVTEYFMPSDFQAPRRVQYGDKIIPESTLAGMDKEGVAWGTTGGSPNNYFIRATTRVVMGFQPWPTSISTKSITMDYYVQAKSMVKLSDEPFNGLPRFFVLDSTLAKYVAYRFFLTIGNLQVAAIYSQEVLADIERFRQIMETLPNYRPGISPSEKR